VSLSELRLVVTADDFDRALTFYRDVLGLPVVADYSSPDGRALMFDAGRARLELFDPRQAEHIDDVEVGRRVAGPVRVAFEVPEAAAATQAAADGGAEFQAAPIRTPWGSLNARLAAPAGLQLTLFSGEPAG
jgi:lactoylglutathione lyase